MKVFISYHRADTKYRHKVGNILNNAEIDYYAVPEDADFNGKRAETIKTYICNRLKECDVMICLIGKETYKRPHIDREIHTALKGEPGVRLGIIGVLLDNRGDSLSNVNLSTFPAKLWDNKNYVVWTEYKDLNKSVNELVKQAKSNSRNRKLQTTHKNPCMPLRATLYYDN